MVLLEMFKDRQVRFIRKGAREVWVPVNDIAEAVGVPKQTLHNIIKKYPELFESYKGINVLLTPGGSQETLCLNRDGVVAVLVKINYNRVKEERRAVIIEFQRWAIETISRIIEREYQPEPFEPCAAIVRDHLEIGKALSEITGVKPGIAYAAALAEAEKETGRSLEAYRKLLPPAEHETGYLNAAAIGKHLGISGQKVNSILASKGLIERKEIGKRRKPWRLTEKGKEFGEEFPFVKNGHSGYQIKWSEKVLDVIDL